MYDSDTGSYSSGTDSDGSWSSEDEKKCHGRLKEKINAGLIICYCYFFWYSCEKEDRATWHLGKFLFKSFDFRRSRPPSL